MTSFGKLEAFDRIRLQICHRIELKNHPNVAKLTACTFRAKLSSNTYWPGRIVNANTKLNAKSENSTSKHYVFFFGSNNFGWIEKICMLPFFEFHDELKSKGKPKDQFESAMNDVEAFIEHPEGFAPFFDPEPLTMKTKASVKFFP